MELSNLDRLIYRYIGIETPKRIAERAGVDVKVVLNRTSELFNEIDVLTTSQQRVKLIAELQEIAHEARLAADSTSDEFKAGMINSAVNAIGSVLKQVEAVEKRDQDKVDQLNLLRVKELVALMNAVVNSGAREVAARYGLDEKEVLGIFRDLLVTEAERLEFEALT